MWSFPGSLPKQFPVFCWKKRPQFWLRYVATRAGSLAMYSLTARGLTCLDLIFTYEEKFWNRMGDEWWGMVLFVFCQGGAYSQIVQMRFSKKTWLYRCDQKQSWRGASGTLDRADAAGATDRYNYGWSTYHPLSYPRPEIRPYSGFINNWFPLMRPY